MEKKGVEKEIIKNRREFLFLYDVDHCNPNGDSLTNEPRIDEDTGICYITPQRLKSVIRQALSEMGEEVFLVEETVRKLLGEAKNEAENGSGSGSKKKGGVSGKEVMVKAVGGADKINAIYIDARLFGGVYTVKKQKKDGEQDIKNVSYIGPVQFCFGRSLHRVARATIHGTCIVPSQESNTQGTMTEKHIIRYGLFAFYGVANEKNAEPVKLTNEDIDKMLKAMWYGIKGCSRVHTDSKMGHEPRLLLEVTYKEGVKDTVGELHRRVRIIPDDEFREEEIRDVSQFVIDITPLVSALEKKKDKIERIRLKIGDRVRVLYRNEEYDCSTQDCEEKLLQLLNSRLSGVKISSLDFEGI